MHVLGFAESDRLQIERVSPDLKVEALLRSRDKSWQALHEIKNKLELGMTEEDARQLAIRICKEKGAQKHWHRQYVRFAAQTQLTFNDPLNTEYRLQKDDPFYIDLGPVWKDEETGLEVEGDVGESFVFGTNDEAQRTADAAKDLFNLAQEHWKKTQCSGRELYGFLEKKTEARGYRLKKDAHGHRLSEFPHHQHSKTQISKLDFSPGPALWVLEVMITHPTLPMGAFYEDLLL